MPAPRRTACVGAARCAPPDGVHRPVRDGPDPGADRTAGVPRVDFALFAPTLDGDAPEASEVWADRVETSYAGGVGLVQVADPAGDLCTTLEPYRLADDTCAVEDGVAVTSMEETSGVGLVRDGTLLYWRSLVTEVDPGLVDRRPTALRDAPPGRPGRPGHGVPGRADPHPDHRHRRDGRRGRVADGGPVAARRTSRSPPTTSTARPRSAPCAAWPAGSVRARRPARRTTAPPAGWPAS